MISDSKANNRACTKCHDDSPVIRREYSGEFLCKKCFQKSIEDKAAKTISKYSMIRYGDRVAVGVSGGKDSLSLLSVLHRQFQNRNNGNELVAITIDEGISGYRDESLSIVKEFCKGLKVENHVLSYKSLFGISMDEAMKTRPSAKMSSCSICGTFRRRAIDLAAEQVGAQVVATGHNLDDHLQTFMINLFAGDVERIGWTHPEPVEYGNGIRKIKPFVEIPEYEIAFYALQRDIPFQSEECPYMDESIRSEIREFMNRLESRHSGIKYSAFNSAVKIATIVRANPTEYNSNKCSSCGRDSSGPICSACKTIRILNSSNKQI
ncbi:MAG: TIGR00269 family protein [Nitrososphaera sp.]